MKLHCLSWEKLGWLALFAAVSCLFVLTVNMPIYWFLLIFSNLVTGWTVAAIQPSNFFRLQQPELAKCQVSKTNFSYQLFNFHRNSYLSFYEAYGSSIYNQYQIIEDSCSETFSERHLRLISQAEDIAAAEYRRLADLD